MPSIADTAKDLLANRRPVLCLDTCELLGAVQCLPQGRDEHVDALLRLYTSHVADPSRVLIVLTELVAHEFGQNILPVRRKATEFLAAADALSRRVHRAASHANLALPNAPSNYSGSPLIHELVALAQRVLGVATVLDAESACIDRAIVRVRAKERPSHTGQIKDSIHLEHYLELSRQLENQGFQERRVFVSSNKADYWQPRTPAHVHSDLAPQYAAVGLEFFGNLIAAVGSLRI